MKLQQITFLKMKKDQDKYKTLELITNPAELYGTTILITSKRGDTFASTIIKADEVSLKCDDEIFNRKNTIYVDFIQKLEENNTIKLYIIQTSRDISGAFK